MEVGGVAEDPEGTGPDKLILAVAAAQEADAEHPGLARTDFAGLVSLLIIQALRGSRLQVRPGIGSTIWIPVLERQRG